MPSIHLRGCVVAHTPATPVLSDVDLAAFGVPDHPGLSKGAPVESDMEIVEL